MASGMIATEAEVLEQTRNDPVLVDLAVLVAGGLRQARNWNLLPTNVRATFEAMVDEELRDHANSVRTRQSGRT